MIREHCAAAFRGPYSIGFAVGFAAICTGSFHLLHELVPEPRPMPLVVGMTALLFAALLLSVSSALSALESLWRFVRAVQAIDSIDFLRALNSIEFRRLLFCSVPALVGGTCDAARLHSSIAVPIGVSVVAMAIQLNRAARTTAPRIGLGVRSVD